jgi:hypothetical protein
MYILNPINNAIYIMRWCITKVKYTSFLEKTGTYLRKALLF